MLVAADMFRKLLDANIPRICVENPIPHRHANLPAYSQKIQPWQFGENFSKATCFWLKGLSPLIPSVLTKPDEIIHACHLEPPGPDRAKRRSRTYPGIADAFAEQWGTDNYQGHAIMEQQR